MKIAITITVIQHPNSSKSLNVIAIAFQVFHEDQMGIN